MLLSGLCQQPGSEGLRNRSVMDVHRNFFNLFSPCFGTKKILLQVIPAHLLTYIGFHAKGFPTLVDSIIQMNMGTQLRDISDGFRMVCVHILN